MIPDIEKSIEKNAKTSLKASPHPQPSEFPETVESDGARHMGSTVWLGLWVKREREAIEELGLLY